MGNRYFRYFCELFMVFFRFCSPRNSEYGFDLDEINWMPVDQYIGGVERNTAFIIFKIFHEIYSLQQRKV